MLMRRPSGGHDEARIIALGIEVAGATAQANGPEPGFPREQGALAQHLVGAHIPEERQEVVHPHAGRNLPAPEPVAIVNRENERQGPDEVGGDTPEYGPFPQRLEDKPQLAMLEVAKPPVYEAAGAAARSEGQVVLLDEHRAQAPHRGVPRDTGTDNATTDNEEIHGSTRCFLQ